MSTALVPLLQYHLPYNNAQLCCLDAFTMALIKVPSVNLTRSVNLTQIALVLNPTAKAASNYRRLQRWTCSLSNSSI